MKKLFISLFILIFISIAYTEEDSEIIKATSIEDGNVTALLEFPTFGKGNIAFSHAKRHVNFEGMLAFYKQNNITVPEYGIFVHTVFPKEYGCCDSSCESQCMTYSSIMQGHKWGVFFVAYKGASNVVGGLNANCRATDYKIKIVYIGEYDGFKCYIYAGCHN